MNDTLKDLLGFWRELNCEAWNKLTPIGRIFFLIPFVTCINLGFLVFAAACFISHGLESADEGFKKISKIFFK